MNVFIFKTLFEHLSSHYSEVNLFNEEYPQESSKEMRYAYKWWTDITQGDLGNCYLIASIAAVSTDP